jgi:putative sterol carrier protein
MTESVQEFFEKLPSRVPAENTAGMTNSYLFEITEAGTWLVTVADGKVEVAKQDGQDPGVDVRITMSEEVFHKLVAGEQNPMRAVMTGKIRVKGNMGAASKLQKILG